jgi:hypothetical protein
MNYQVPFADALKNGNDTEKIVLAKIKTVNPQAYLTEGKVAEYDIVIPETGQTVEVKNDTRCCGNKNNPEPTNNVFVETGRADYDNPKHITSTGINVTTADVWVFNLGDGFYWIRTENLKEMVALFPIVRGGDDNRTFGAKIPKTEFLKKAYYWFK